MSKKIFPVQGILIPDLSFDLICIKLNKSTADMMLQLEKKDNPNASSGQLKYRTLRKVDKWIYGESDSAVLREEMKKATKLLCDTFEWEKNNYKIKLSDIRNLGHWALLKGIFIPYRNSSDFKSLWSLCDYAFNLCEEEKKNIAQLRKKHEIEIFIKIIEKSFCVDKNIVDKAKEAFSDIASDDEYHDAINKNFKFIASLTIHQHLLMAAVLEQYYYTYYTFPDSKYGIERMVIKRFLPSLEANKFVGSMSKLINKIFKESEYQTKEKFYEGLSNSVFIDPDSIERKITRWRTGGSPVKPDDFNKLFKSIMEVPNEIIIACSISDTLSRELIKQGISKKWIVDEFSKYSKYQSQVIDACE